MTRMVEEMPQYNQVPTKMKQENEVLKYDNIHDEL